MEFKIMKNGEKHPVLEKIFSFLKLFDEIEK